MRMLKPVIAALLTVIPVISMAETDTELPFNPQHPVDAALTQKSDGTWVYLSFPSGARLYVYEGDEEGQSNCYGGCASAWPPLRVSSEDSAEPVGDWTIVSRDDGIRQWAYQGQPVYHRFHDMPGGTEDDRFKILVP